jgi:hypothetical protein
MTWSVVIKKSGPGFTRSEPPGETALELEKVTAF